MGRNHYFTYRSFFPCSVAELYNFHARPGALERLLPPWDGSEVVWKKGTLAPGGRVLMKLRQGPFSIPWEAHHIAEEPGKMFHDIQHRGPFSKFSHVHSFSSVDGGAVLEDHIEFTLPFSSTMPRIAERQVAKMLTRIFSYREHTLTEDLLLHGRCSKKPLRVLISGASGVLGKVLVPLLTTGGHEVWRLVRRPAKREESEIFWDPMGGVLDLSEMPPIDGVIHLAGEYIGLGRWTAAKKKSVIESRTRGTSLLATKIAQLEHKPKSFLSASAVGYYGDCGDTAIAEAQSEGNDFISEVCRLWEQAAAPALEAGIRTVLLRLGVGLTPRGGALERLLIPGATGIFKRFGSGDQYVSWMSIDDMVAAMLHCLVTPELHGPVNVAAPEPVTNEQLLSCLAQTVGTKQFFSVPQWLLKLIYGQMATEIVLSGCRVSTMKLTGSGFRHRHPELHTGLEALMGLRKNYANISTSVKDFT